MEDLRIFNRPQKGIVRSEEVLTIDSWQLHTRQCPSIEVNRMQTLSIFGFNAIELSFESASVSLRTCQPEKTKSGKGGRRLPFHEMKFIIPNSKKRRPTRRIQLELRRSNQLHSIVSHPGRGGYRHRIPKWNDPRGAWARKYANN
ncbi:unnamed protein product [Nesidiocoris tenuis]|uniref:Uncharacterized protein n=1 Tax=Nesidiocoris tenuis TaxID=355587 RepID=A0A6H5HQE9_9HEMI|nr:unnamed protein product [Nesidiocoris tenuis]